MKKRIAIAAGMMIMMAGTAFAGQFTVCICPGDYDASTDMLTSFMINLLY